MAEINKIQFKRGSTLSNAGTPSAGEPIYDTTTKKLYIGDGSSPASGTGALVAISDDKLPLTGGTITSNLSVNGTITQGSGVLTIKNASSDSNGLRIFQDSSDASKIYNNYNGTLQLGVGNTTAITIDSSEKSTLAGELRVDGGQASIYGVSGGDATLELNASLGDDNNDKWKIFVDQSDNKRFKIASYASGSWVDKIRMDTSNLYIDDIGYIQVSNSSDPGLRLVSSESNTDNWFMYVAGSGLKFRNTTDSNTALELTHANNAVFSGDVTASGSVTVDSLNITNDATITSTTKVFQVRSHTDNSKITKHGYDGLYTSGAQHQYIQSAQDIKFYPGGSNTVTFASGGLVSLTGSITTTGSTITVDPASGDATLLLQGAGGSQTVRIDQNSIRTTTNTALSIFTNNTAANGISINQSGPITFNQAYTFPTSIGSSGQVLKVPSGGMGLVWADDTSGGNSVSGDLTVTDYESKITLTKTRNTTQSFHIAHENDDGVLDFLRDTTRTARITNNGRWVIGGYTEVNSSALSVQGNTGLNGDLLITGNRTLRVGGTGSETQSILVLGGSNAAGSRVALQANSDNSYLDSYGGEGSTERYRDFTYAARTHIFRTGGGSSLGTAFTIDSSQNVFANNIKIGSTHLMQSLSAGNMRITGNNSAAVGINLYADSNNRGWIYANDSSQIGFLNTSGGWDLRKTMNSELTLVVSGSDRTVIHSGNYGSYPTSWSSIPAGTRQNYTLKLQPTSSPGYAGFEFMTEAGGSAGYFLIRKGSDGLPTYTANGITLVADTGHLNFVQRTSSSHGIRFATGSSPVQRMFISNGGDVTFSDNVTHGGNIQTATSTDYAVLYGIEGGLRVLSSRSSDAGILWTNNSGAFRGQLYGDGSNYGFLDAHWGGWDVKKVINGQLEVYGSGNLKATFGSSDAWGRIQHENGFTNGVYLYTGHGNFRVDGGNWNTYTDAEHDLGGGQTSERWRNLYLQGQIVGGFGAMGTGGTTDWNDSSNARAGAGYTLLLGSHSNGPSGTGDYFHTHSYEYGSSGGGGNMCQFAIPYIVGNGGGMYMRSRYSNSWGGWVKFHDSNNLYGIARTSNTYGSFNVADGQNSWAGITYSTHSSKPTIMFKDNHGDGGLYHQGSSSWRWYYDQSNSCMGINGSATNSSYGAYVTGSVYTTGSYGSSDIRFKENIETIENGLDKVMNMRGVYFDWIDEHKAEKGKSRQVGVIAQEINEVLPEVVMHQDNDEYAVDYSKITGVLIEAIKDLKNEINELKGS